MSKYAKGTLAGAAARATALDELLAQHDSSDDDDIASILRPSTTTAAAAPKTVAEALESDSSDEDNEIVRRIIAQEKAAAKDGAKIQAFQYDASKLEGPDFGSSDDNDDQFEALTTATTRAKPQVVVQTQDVMQLVEHNEKMNEGVCSDIITQASQLLSFDKDYYDVKKELMTHSCLSAISQKLFEQKEHKYYGPSSCITMFDQYLFVGNSVGIIRVFDTKSNKEMKPLLDEQLMKNKVTCLSITGMGQYLLAGYKKGTLALWDLSKYKLLKLMDDVHDSEVTGAKIFHITDEGVVNIVSCEDQGRVRLVEVSVKGFFGNISYNKNSLFERRLKRTASVALLAPNLNYPNSFTDTRAMIAFGAMNEVVVCSMRPIAELFKIKRPHLCKDNSVPYLDWGYGLTPTMQERTVPILAVAWDCLIQLVYIDDETREIVMDGYYCSE